MPRWVSKPFRRFVDFLDEIHQVLTLSAQGITQISRMVPLAEALADLAEHDRLRSEADPSGDDSEPDLHLTRQQAELAQTEIDRDFPLLHGHSVVAIWSALESLAEDVLVSHLKNCASIREHENFRKIKVNLATYENLDEDSRCRFLAVEIQNQMNANLRRGISRFDSVFGLVGVEVPIEDQMRRDFFELNCVRNAIVHNASRADDALIADCPWLDLSPGEVLEVSHASYWRYRVAVSTYITSVINQMAVLHPTSKQADVE